MRSVRCALLLFACASLCQPGAAGEPAISREQQSKLASWHDALGEPRADERFGAYLARAARIQHGVDYEDVPPPLAEETLHVNLDAFECVSFIESAIAVARCGWRRDRSEACFVQELEASRYRGGEMVDYASRLHYFVDWIDDNERRGRVENLTESLGGVPVQKVQKDFYYITARRLPRSTLTTEEIAKVAEDVRATERRLSATSHAILTRESAPPVLRDLEDGDLVAFVRERPGLLVHHAGFVLWADGTPRLLHASSFHQRVVITIRDLTNYLLRRPERRGVIVARPLEPAR